MHVPTVTSDSSLADTQINLRYVWTIAAVAALGGLLFGYDWVVIGGAKPFFESYFGLTSPSQIGWANSCALIGCFVGSFIGGRLSDYIGRKRVLIIAAALFTVSSVLTGWSFSFTAFIFWRIVGGVAIGLASNVSPTYIAEISPAPFRGRLVSLNQLAIVVGILTAQLANWRIARPVPGQLTAQMLFASWNVQFGWRWMFTAVALPALLFLVTIPFIPESPRWLVAHDRVVEAHKVLGSIGGEKYGELEIESIQASLLDRGEVPWSALFHGKVGVLLLIGIALAVLQQGSGINVLFNYAEEVFQSAGYGLNDIMFNIVITGAINLAFTVVAMFLVDRLGRRKLMIAGCVLIAACHLGASVAFRSGHNGALILAFALGAIASYAMTLAPVTWVLITEIFPNRYRGSAVSISVAALWLASFVLTYSFPILNRLVSAAGAFAVYGGICLAGAVFVFLAVPQTTGKSLDKMEI